MNAMTKKAIDLAIDAYKGNLCEAYAKIVTNTDGRSLRDQEYDAIIENITEYNTEIMITKRVTLYIKSKLN